MLRLLFIGLILIVPRASRAADKTPPAPPAPATKDVTTYANAFPLSMYPQYYGATAYPSYPVYIWMSGGDGSSDGFHWTVAIGGTIEEVDSKRDAIVKLIAALKHAEK